VQKSNVQSSQSLHESKQTTSLMEKGEHARGTHSPQLPESQKTWELEFVVVLSAPTTAQE